MKNAPLSKGALPENYVRELGLRSPVSFQVYLSILKGFQRFVAEKAEDKSVSEATIRQWSSLETGYGRSTSSRIAPVLSIVSSTGE